MEGESRRKWNASATHFHLRLRIVFFFFASSPYVLQYETHKWRYEVTFAFNESKHFPYFPNRNVFIGLLFFFSSFAARKVKCVRGITAVYFFFSASISQISFINHRNFIGDIQQQVDVSEGFMSTLTNH